MIDPVDVATRPLVKLIEHIIRDSIPIRIGLVMKVNTDNSANGLSDPGVGILYAFNYLSQEKSTREALAFLNNVS